MNIGVDCVEIKRFQKIIRNRKILEKIFTPEEISYCQKHKAPEKYFAVRFAGKEAVQKAITTEIPFNQIRISNGKNGKPFVRILKPGLTSWNLKISLSHTEQIAIAFVVAFNNKS